MTLEMTNRINVVKQTQKERGNSCSEVNSNLFRDSKPPDIFILENGTYLQNLQSEKDRDLELAAGRFLVSNHV